MNNSTEAVTEQEMANNSTVADIENNQHLVSNNLAQFSILIIVSSFALISSILSVCFLHTYLKKLHHILKIILSFWCGYNLVCCIVNVIILIYFRFKGQQTLALCGLIQLTTITPAKISFDTVGIISVVRYYMTWKTNQLELFKKHWILISVGAIYLVEHLLSFFFFIIAQMDYPMLMLSTVCAGKDVIKTMTAIGIFNILKMVCT